MKKGKSLQDKAMLALKKAVREVIANHKRTGRSLSVWSKGRVVHLPARSIK